jgi:mannose-6-phosphate isomerase
VPADRLPPAPWPLGENRVSRFYRGGALLEAFRGAAPAAAHDTDRPEDWVGSTVRAWSPPGAPPTDEGLSRIATAAGERTIASLLAADPAAVGGARLVDRAGPSSGVLVKLLDAAIRLPVHAHPTRDFARRVLSSFFGKAEAWIVLAVREIEGEEPPNVRLGFARDVGRDELRGWIEGGDSAALLAAMHARPAHVGDVWFVPPGMPHAIGAGTFIVEVQEPTDFSIVAEVAGFPVDPLDASLGLGWDVAIDAFDRRGRSEAEVDALRQPATRIDDGSAPGVERLSLLGPATSPFFRAERVVLAPGATGRPARDPAYLVGVVTAGAGTAAVGGNAIPIRRGSTFAVPASATADLELVAATGDEPLAILACRAPRAEDLDTP